MNKEYLLFDARREGFDDGEGNMVSLGDHLHYVDTQGGTPDNFDTIEAASASQARGLAKRKNSSMHMFVVDTETMKVVGNVNDPSKEKEDDADMSM